MRAAILVPPPSASPKTTDASSAIIGALLEDALASSASYRRVVPLPAGGVTATLARAFDIDANEHPDAVLMVVVGSHRLLDPAGAEALGFERALDEAAQVADDEVESWISQGYEAMSSGDLERAEECYLAADRLLGYESSPRRALVLVSLGDIARAQGRIEQAIV